MIIFFSSFGLDGDRGTPSRSVDTQRNRILATAALKEAETLADQGKMPATGTEVLAFI